MFKLWPESLSLERARDEWFGILCCRYGGRVGFVACFRSSQNPIWHPVGTPKWVWEVLMTLLETCASCGWIWSRSLHSRTVCSRYNSSKSFMLILERLMIAEARTSVPGTSWRADKTSNVQLPFWWASLKSASLILLSKALLLVKRLFQKRSTQRNQ